MILFAPTVLATIFCAIFSWGSALLNEASENTTSGLFEIGLAELNPQNSSLTTENIYEAPAVNSTESAGVVPKIEILNTNLSLTKRDIINETLNDIKPFLSFPFLPFLFPPKKEKKSSKPNEFKIQNTTENKPFILFDFAFNIREIPLNNSTQVQDKSRLGDELDLPILKDWEKNPRKRRNSGKKSSGFFDDFSLFPDSGIEEFFPKPEFFFPDLFFKPKPLKKLSRRKRDKLKQSVPNSFKLFEDAFDEAFTQTKRDLEHTDPILSFLRGAERSLKDEKKSDEFLPPRKESYQWSTMKKKRASSPKAPLIILDEVVKIGEFRLHDDGKGRKMKKKNAKYLDEENHGELNFEKEKQQKGDTGLSLLRMLEQPWQIHPSNKRKRNHDVTLEEEKKKFPKIILKEIKVLPDDNISDLSVGKNYSLEVKEKNVEINTRSTQGEVKVEDRPKRRTTGYQDTHKPHYDDLKKNITEVLNRFLALVKKMDEARLVDKHDEGEGTRFDWTEKETLQNEGVLKKEHREKRGNDLDFAEEYAEVENRERQIANLNYLFLTVTLPTLLVFALMLVICFFNLRIKGKICTKLFKPRPLYIIEEEKSSKPSSNITSKQKKSQVA